MSVFEVVREEVYYRAAPPLKTNQLTIPDCSNIFIFRVVKETTLYSALAHFLFYFIKCG